MIIHELMPILFLIVLLILVTPILGSYMAGVFSGKLQFFPIRWAEVWIYRLCGIKENEESNWKGYATSLLLFNFVGFLFLFLLQLFQSFLGLNPEGFGNVEWSLALNTAVSFTTNTDWQAYPGETTLSYLTQMVGLTVQNFFSAASGNAALLVLIRGITRKNATTIGNFFVDLTRTILYLLLPLSIAFALFLVSQGVIQNFKEYRSVTTLEKAEQKIPMGPVASQVAIKQLGTNGGGFFNANSAHPFENPTPLSNFLQLFAILCIPAATVYMFGCLTGFKSQGVVILAAMFGLWIIGVGIAWGFAELKNPIFPVQPILEGQEVRIGMPSSLLWAVSTTATANGSVNCMHSSLPPISGGMALFNIMLGEVVFGGVGVGLCGMLMFVLLTIFLSGLMVGRTPEYLGKKIEKREMRWVMLAILLPSTLILVGSGIACIFPLALKGLGNQGPHGLSEILYAFASCSANNGSAFAGLNANTFFYNFSLALCMAGGRFAILIASLAIGGTLVKKNAMAPSSGTFATNTPLFAILLGSVILIVGGLTFFPALSLGPIIENILMLKGKTF